MSCEKCQEMLALYALEELEPERIDQFEKHLEECEKCRDDLQTYRQIMADLSPAQDPGLNDLERLRLENRVLRDLSQAVGDRADGARGRVSSPVWQVAAAGVIFLLGYGFNTLFSDRGTDGSDPLIIETPTAVDYEYAQLPGSRLSARGLKVIAHGKAALEKP